MTTPVFTPCVTCGHEKIEHERDGFEPQCVMARCTCLSYRASLARPTPRPAVTGLAHTPPAGTVPITGKAQLDRARATGVPKIIKLADRIDADLRTLAELVEEHEGKAAARAEVERLEQQLADARAKLRGDRTPPKPKAATQVAPTGEHACPVEGCDRTFGSGQAVAMHRRRAHEGFDPNA